MNVEELKALSERVANDPEEVYNLSPDEAIELQKYLNPLGNIVAENKSYANLSIVNWTEKYMRRLITTGLIGYIYRLQSEYNPDDEIEASRKRMESKIKTLSEPADIAKARAEHEAEAKLLTKTARSMVKKFLDRNFNYNPDYHLRGSHTDGKGDPERKDRAEAIKEACTVGAAAPTVESKLEAKPDATYKYLRSNLLQAYQNAVEITDTTKRILTTILDPELDNRDKQGILLKRYKQMVDIVTDMKKIAAPISTADVLNAWKVDPPADVFHQFDRYLTNHYEQIREVCAALYAEKPDIEYAVIYYKSFDNPESASQHQNQHESHFRAEVLTIENSGVTLIGPFKENRERVKFYNKNVEIMKRMMEQMETDHKLGKDLMTKDVKKQKKLNIMRDGPDAPGLKDYARSNNVAAADGAKKILTREEEEAINAARIAREDAEVPEDAIQIDMFFPKTNEDGETSLVRKKMYSRAEAPLHLQEGSEFHERYQPVRDNSESVVEAYNTKTIVSKTGERKEIKVLASGSRGDVVSKSSAKDKGESGNN